MPEFPDFQTVRTKVGGLKGVITKLGDAPEFDHKWKSFSKCPFCAHKNCAGVYTSKQHGQEEFKCNHADCSTGRRAVTEVGYVAMKLGLSEQKPVSGGPSPAYEHLLKMAGCWEEPAANPKSAIQKPGEGVDPHAEEEMILACMDVIRSEQKASASLLQRRLRIGYSRASRILDELERRGIVGPARGVEPRTIMLDVRFNPKAFENAQRSEVRGQQPENAGLPNPVLAAAAAVPVASPLSPSGELILPPQGGVPGPEAALRDGGGAPVQEINVGETNAGSANPGQEVPDQPMSLPARS